MRLSRLPAGESSGRTGQNDKGKSLEIGRQNPDLRYLSHLDALPPLYYACNESTESDCPERV